MTRQEICELYPDESFLFLDPPDLDAAIIGVTSPAPGRPTIVIAYDQNKIINIFADKDGMTLEEAADWVSFNTIGAWMGEKTPILLEVVS